MFDLTGRGSESDVYRRQILTTKVDPRAVRVMYEGHKIVWSESWYQAAVTLFENVDVEVYSL